MSFTGYARIQISITSVRYDMCSTVMGKTGLTSVWSPYIGCVRIINILYSSDNVNLHFFKILLLRTTLCQSRLYPPVID